MKMRWWVVIIIHCNNNSQKTAYFWHLLTFRNTYLVNIE
jgi:hypothetical protein